MNRIEKAFANLKNKKAFIPYLLAGDPNLDISEKLLHTYAEAGADLIEIGIPFSEPVADGPVIQKAHIRALKNHVSLHDIFKLVKNFRKSNQNTPIILMTYVNPIEIFGYNQFVLEAKQSGVDGVLIVDLPPEEGKEFYIQLKEETISPIFLITQTTPENRKDFILKQAHGFIYYVSLKGVTGSKIKDIEFVNKSIAHLKEKTKIPIAVGFGITDAKTAKKMSKSADAIIIATTLVEMIEHFEKKNDSKYLPELLDNINAFIKEINQAL
ncbi:MAG: tryptophan synthase subunit alpha [Gammaproteobacteria bacterium]